MTQILWIFIRRNQHWTNGKYTVTQEIIESYPWDKIRDIIHNDTGMVVCQDRPSLFPLPRPAWEPLPLEQIIAILDGK